MRLSRLQVRIACAIALSALAAACASLPEISFDPQDAGASAIGDATTDLTPSSGEDADAAGDDAGATDANDEVSVFDMDALPVYGDCPDAMPIGVNWCCDDTPCRGGKQKCKTVCTTCETQCGTSTCCLDKQGDVQGCADAAATCPAP